MAEAGSVGAAPFLGFRRVDSPEPIGGYGATASHRAQGTAKTAVQERGPMAAVQRACARNAGTRQDCGMRPKTTDRYSRTVAVCRADREDLGRSMVQLGMAWAFVRYSQDCVGVETQAKTENLGVHGWQCVPAWEWRAHQRK